MFEKYNRFGSRSSQVNPISLGTVVIIVLTVLIMTGMIYSSIQNERNYMSEGTVISKTYDPETFINGTFYPATYSITITDGTKDYIKSIDPITYSQYEIGSHYRE